MGKDGKRWEKMGKMGKDGKRWGKHAKTGEKMRKQAYTGSFAKHWKHGASQTCASGTNRHSFSVEPSANPALLFDRSASPLETSL
jgi:hypothetical protein